MDGLGQPRHRGSRDTGHGDAPVPGHVDVVVLAQLVHLLAGHAGEAEHAYLVGDVLPGERRPRRLELGAQRGAPARLLKPLQGSFAHNEQTLSASAATALKRAKEIFDEYITTVVDPPTIFELIPEHATFTQTYVWNKGRNGGPAETYRDRYAKIVGDVRSDGYALLFNRGEDDGTVPYIPTSQDRFKFGLDLSLIHI